MPLTPKQKKLRQSIIKRIIKIDKKLIPSLQDDIVEAELNNERLSLIQLKSNLDTLLEEGDFLRKKLKEFDGLFMKGIRDRVYKNIGGL
jgi:hypothetical protein